MSEIGIGVSKAELARFERQMKAATEKQTKRLQEVVTASAYRVHNGAIDRVPKSTSALAGSIKVVHSQNRLSARVTTNKRYAPYVEFGTKTKFDAPAELSEVAAQFRNGSAGTFDDLLDAIKLWVVRKGIEPKAAFPIALTLARLGQKTQPFLYPAFKAEQDNFIKGIKRAMQ